MADAIEQAAAMFEQEISGKPASRSNGGAGGEAQDREQEPEPMFGNSDRIENAGEDAGGDVGDDDEEDTRRRQRETEPDEEEEDADDEDGDDEEDEDADDEDGDDEEDEDDDPTLKQKFAIVVDGEETEVTLKEALNGYIRAETFHRRLNKVNEASQIVQQQAAAVVADRQKYIQMLDDLSNQMEALIPKEPDWDALYKEDPAKARELEKQYREYKAAVEKTRADRDKARKEAEIAEQRATQEFAKREFPKFVKAAKWKSQKDAERDLKAMRRTAFALGFSEEEVSSVYDSRMLTVLLKASKYDRMMAARPRPVNPDGKKKPNAKGAGRTRTAPKGIERAQKQLSRSGSIEDAQRVFERIIQS